MMEICFNNREADIGAFVRRQLSGLDGEKLIEAMHDTVRTIRTPTATELLTAYMDEMYVRFVKRRNKCSPRPIKPGTRESAAIILGDFTHPDLSRQYMTRFLQVRRYSGWPPWVALMNVHSSLGHVAYVDDGWESFEYVTEMFHALDFSRMDASGKFYYVEALWDDMATQVPPGQHLEIVTETARVTEIIATCIAFAHEFCGSDTSTNLAFAFRWRGLTGRRLSTWAHPQRGFRSREVAEQDEIITSITLPVATVPDAIAFHVEALVKPLFRLFGGWEFESSVIEGIVAGRLNSQF